MLSLKAMARQNSAKTADLLSKIEHQLASWSKSASELRDARELLEKMTASATNPYEELLWTKVSGLLEIHGKLVTSMAVDIRELSRAENDASYSTSSYVDSLLDETKRLLLMPCSTLFDGVPLAIRQLSKQLGKVLDYTITGGEIEIDKRILEQMKDPITHIIRNGLNHGIESADERTAAGKPARGKLRDLRDAEGTHGRAAHF